MDILPYPPAPEFGWYAEDTQSTPDAGQPTTDQPAQQAEAQQASPAQSAPATDPSDTGTPAPEQASSAGLSAVAESVSMDFVGSAPAAASPEAEAEAGAEPQPSQPHAAMNADGDIEDWDSTVLSTSFTAKTPHKTWLLHNEITGQTIVIDRGTLLGRKPSRDVPEGAKAERVLDPTRTTSRNHAAISIDPNGELWVEDYGSLNGTFIIRDNQETQVKDRPFHLEAPATLRIGDQFFKLTEQQD